MAAALEQKHLFTPLPGTSVSKAKLIQPQPALDP